MATFVPIIVVGGMTICSEQEDMYTVLEADDGREYRKLAQGWMEVPAWKEPILATAPPELWIPWAECMTSVAEPQPEKKPRGRPKKIMASTEPKKKIVYKKVGP